METFYTKNILVTCPHPTKVGELLYGSTQLTDTIPDELLWNIITVEVEVLTQDMLEMGGDITKFKWSGGIAFHTVENDEDAWDCDEST